MIYDYLIIGGGMAGLYAGLCLRQSGKSFLLLEKDNRIGGRAGNDIFHTATVVTGAGIGRMRKDRLLLRLMRGLGMPINTFKFRPHHLTEKSVEDVQNIFHTLRHSYRHSQHRGMTFEAYAKHMLGSKLYHQFVKAVGYTDYLQEDVYETLHHYGMDDNVGFNGFSVNWNDLVDRMVKRMGRRHIRMGCEVGRISKSASDIFCVNTNLGEYRAHSIILATPIDTLRRLLPLPVYNGIEGQSFLRLYAKFDKVSAERMTSAIKRYTVVDSPLQKILPTKADDGIYMISYSDNANADTVMRKKRELSDADFKLWLERQVEKALDLPRHSVHITHTRAYYWPIGTHYYRPLPRSYPSREQFIRHATHPAKGIYVVGEAVSRHQGWVEGALQSVQRWCRKW